MIWIIGALVLIVLLIALVIYLTKNKKKPESFIDTPVESVSLYMLTYNNPRQVKHTWDTWKQNSKDWFTIPKYKILLDNSTVPDLIEENKQMAREFGFEYIHPGRNLGITGGRVYIAKHFQQSDSSHYVFFEDDMGLHPSDGHTLCKNGFSQNIPNLLKKALDIVDKEGLDFLKLSFTEVFFSHDVCYPKIESKQLDTSTDFSRIKSLNELPYALGDVFYCNWPLIISKEGNKKIFFDYKGGENPSELNLMMESFPRIQKGEIKCGVLLASPVWHNRVYEYEQGERVENATI